MIYKCVYVFRADKRQNQSIFFICCRVPKVIGESDTLTGVDVPSTCFTLATWLLFLYITCGKVWILCPVSCAASFLHLSATQARCSSEDLKLSSRCVVLPVMNSKHKKGLLLRYGDVLGLFFGFVFSSFFFFNRHIWQNFIANKKKLVPNQPA